MKDQIIEMEKRLLDAIKINNVAELDLLIHKDMLFNTPQGLVVNKDQDLDNYRSGQVKIQELKASGQQISPIDQHTAVVSVTIKLKGQYQEYQLDESYQYLRVWQYSGKSWQIIAGSCVKV